VPSIAFDLVCRLLVSRRQGSLCLLTLANPTLEVPVVHSVRRNLAYGLGIVAMAISLAMAWGSPFVSEGTARAQDQAQPQQPAQPDPDQAKSATFTGTIVRDGEQFSLRDSSGETFKLDDSERAKPFVGKAVKVTGQLDEQAKMIHVESIESASA